MSKQRFLFPQHIPLLFICLLVALAVSAVTASAQPYVYATSTLSNAISVIDSRTYNFVTSVSTGNMTYPAQVALSPDGAYLYVTNRGNNTVSILKTATNSVVQTVSVGSSPWGVAVTPNGAFAYVANQVSNNVSVINTASQSVIKTITVGAGPLAVAASPNGTHVWVTCGSSNQIAVIDTATNQVSNLPAGNNPVSVAFLPNGSRAYVSNSFDNSVAVYDVNSGNVVSRIPIEGQPNSIAISPDGSRVFVTGLANKTLYIVNTATNQVLKTVGVGNIPDGVAVSSDGASVWVSNAQDWSLSVVNPVSGSVVATLPGLAYDPQGIVVGGSPTIRVSLSPQSVSLRSGLNQQFTAAVTGTSNTAVTWSISPNVGTISGGGLYIAPSQITQNQTVTVKATSVADTSKFATATVTLQPGVSVSVTPTSATLVASQMKQFTATVSGSSNTAVTWSISPMVGAISSSGVYTAPGIISATQTVTVKATSVADTGKSASAVVTLTPNVSFSPIRVNSGGPAYTDSNGNRWSADYGYSGGSSSTSASAIQGTNAPVLYQSNRQSAQTFQYQFSVPNGSYTVNLKFAETYLPATVGARSGNYLINGKTVLKNFDVLANAHYHNTAIDRAFPVNVTNGQIVIQIVPVAGRAQVNALQILRGNGSPIRVNSGGTAAYTDPLGNVWSADFGFTGGRTSAYYNAIANTSTPVVYQTQRYTTATYKYQFPVANGIHFVILKFAEIYAPAQIGQRRGNYQINGQTVLSNFDVLAAAGGHNIALDKQFEINVTNGQIVIQIVPVTGYPQISAIEID